MNILRIYKLKELGITIDPLHQETIEQIESMFDDLIKTRVSDYTNTFYFNKNHECVAYTENNKIHYNYDLITGYGRYRLNKDMMDEFVKFIMMKKYSESKKIAISYKGFINQVEAEYRHQLEVEYRQQVEFYNYESGKTL